MKKIGAFILLYVIAVSIALASPLEEFAKGYKEGTALIEQSDYKELYEKSSDRKVEFKHVQEFEGRIDAYYKTSMLMEGEPLSQEGVGSFYVENGKVVRVEFAPIKESYIDLAIAGQAADIASTAVGLNMGFVEGNSAISGIIATPVGAALIAGTKLGMAWYVGELGLRECMQYKAFLGSLGWGAASWNVATMLSVPSGAGVAIAAGAAALSWKVISEYSAVDCIKPV